MAASSSRKPKNSLAILNDDDVSRIPGFKLNQLLLLPYYNQSQQASCCICSDLPASQSSPW